MKYITSIVLVFLSNMSFGYSSDTGVVTRIYTTPSGAIAFKIEGGFVKAEETNQCESANGWAGISESDPVLKSLILAAKLTKSSVTVAIEGCNNRWFKILSILLN